MDTDPAHNSSDPNDLDPAHHQVTAPVWAPCLPTTPQPDASGEITQPVLNTTGANWLGEWSGRDPHAYVKSLVDGAQGRTLLLIGYFMYGRDNGNYSAGGAHNEQEFLDFYAAVSRAVGDVSAIVVVEPDALGLLDGLDVSGKRIRLELLQGAIDALNAKPNIKIYLDASTWVPAADMVRRLNLFHSFDGFSCNVSGWDRVEELSGWAEEVSVGIGRPYIVDTSRNGNGNPHKPAWCNVTDTLVGVAPTTKTHSRNCEMYLWCKVPGESDGKGINDNGSQPRDDVPAAGTYWPEFKDAIYSGDWTSFKQKYGV